MTEPTNRDPDLPDRDSNMSKLTTRPVDTFVASRLMWAKGYLVAVRRRWPERRLGIGVLVAACAFAIALLVPDAALAGGASRKPSGISDPAVHAVRWGCLIGLGVVLAIVLLGVLVRAQVSRLFSGQDNRMSTSKTMAAVWTLIVAALFLGCAYVRSFSIIPRRWTPPVPRAWSGSTRSCSAGRWGPRSCRARDTGHSRSASNSGWWRG